MKKKRDVNLFVKETSTIKQAMKIINVAGWGLAVVIDKNKFLGIITDGDIRRAILKGVSVNKPVVEIYNKTPITISKKMPAKYFAALLNKQEVKDIYVETGILKIPIVDHGKFKDIALLYFNKNNQNKITVKYIFTKENKVKLKNQIIKRVAIIGGAGYIGSILVRKLLALGYKVNVLDKFIYGKESLEGLEADSSLKIIFGDTRHIEDISFAIKNVDAVVHLAELVGDPACALNPLTTQEINYIATKTVAEMCKYFQINRLIYASSCSVYGASEGDNLLTEESALNPQSLYAKMKISSEQALNDMLDENFMPTILRLGTVFGFSYRPRFDLVVNLLTAQAIKENKITIFGGDQWRPNVHVTDVVKTIVTCLQAPIDKIGGKIFNVGDEANNCTISRIGELIKKNIPSTKIFTDKKVVDRRDYKTDFSRLKNVLKIKMEKNLDSGIREIMNAFKKTPGLNHRDKKYSNIKVLSELSIVEKIKGQTIYLRELTESDATTEYCAWLNDPLVNRYLATRQADIVGLKRYIKKQQADINSFFVGIFSQIDDQHIGNMKLEPIDWNKKTAVFGLLIGNKNYWGKGVGTEATKLLIDHAFTKMGLEKITLGVMADNKAAIRVYEKIGFKIDKVKSGVKLESGEQINYLMMSINKKVEIY